MFQQRPYADDIDHSAPARQDEGVQLDDFTDEVSFPLEDELEFMVDTGNQEGRIRSDARDHLDALNIDGLYEEGLLLDEEDFM